jgi:predicted DNA-binding protein
MKIVRNNIERDARDTTISAKVPKEIKDRLADMAEKEDRTISYYVNKFIEIGMKECSEKPEAA